MRDRLDELAKAAAVAGIALYLVGFAVVVFHDASYGFIAFNAFRARIVGAGLLFAVFFIPGFCERSVCLRAHGICAAIRCSGGSSLDSSALPVADLPSIRTNLEILDVGVLLSISTPRPVLQCQWSRLALYFAYVAVKSIPQLSDKKRFLASPAMFVGIALAVDAVAVGVAIYLRWFVFGVILMTLLFPGRSGSQRTRRLDR